MEFEDCKIEVMFELLHCMERLVGCDCDVPFKESAEYDDDWEELQNCIRYADEELRSVFNRVSKIGR